MPCGITFLGLSFVEVNPSVWVAIVLSARQFFVNRCMLLFMLASLIFVKRPRLQTRIFPDHQDNAALTAPRVSASPDLESEEPNNFRNVFGIFINSVTSER